MYSSEIKLSVSLNSNPLNCVKSMFKVVMGKCVRKGRFNKQAGNPYRAVFKLV